MKLYLTWEAREVAETRNNKQNTQNNNFVDFSNTWRRFDQNYDKNIFSI